MILTLHQRHDFDFPPAIFDIPITVAAITYTTTTQQKAKRMSLNHSLIGTNEMTCFLTPS
jgi:hypothetical protein